MIRARELTDEGKEFLEEHTKKKKEIRKRFKAFRSSFHGPLPWFNFYPEKARELFEAGKSLAASSWNLLDSLRDKYPEEAAVKAKEVLKQATEKLDEITRSLKETD